MKITCPACSHTFETAKARRAPVDELNKTYASFGPEEMTVREYLDCFRVSRESANSLPKEKRILEDLAAMWFEEAFEFKGRNWTTTREKIRNAVLAAATRQLIGLMNHNYIKKILWTQAAQAERTAETVKHKAAFDKPRKPEAEMQKAIPAPKPKEDPAAIQRMIDETKAKLSKPEPPASTPEEIEVRRQKLMEQARLQGANLNEV